MEHFDIHIHMNSDAARAVLPTMQKQGAERYVLLSLGAYRGDLTQNEAVLYAKALDPEHSYAFYAPTHPINGEPVPDYLAELKRWLNAGCDGLKLIETKANCAKATGVRLDDMAFDPMFAYCEEHGVPILWHNGDPATYWDPKKCPPKAIRNGWSYIDGSFLSLEELYAITETVLDRHPRLKVTFAHFYFVSDDPAHAGRMMEKYPNLRFDLTPGPAIFGGFTENADFFRSFFLRYADRILLGSDTNVAADGSDYGPLVTGLVERFLRTDEEYDFFGFRVKGFKLPEDILEKILRSNAAAFVGDVPRAISPEGAVAACQEVISLLEARQAPGAALGRRLAEDLKKTIW